MIVGHELKGSYLTHVFKLIQHSKLAQIELIYSGRLGIPVLQLNLELTDNEQTILLTCFRNDKPCFIMKQAIEHICQFTQGHTHITVKHKK